MRKYVVFLLVGLLLSAGVGSAKDNVFYKLSGNVVAADNGSPVEFASVIINPGTEYVVTDKNGAFHFDKIQSDKKISLSVIFYGMEQVDTTFVMNKDIVLKITLKPTTFSLEEVAVVGKQNKAGASTSSTISRQALDHLQTSSLYDVMALLPGGTTSNPNLNSAQSFTIRTAGGSGSGMDLNSLGTAIMVDGAPMSNNANMQVLSPTIAAGTSYKSGAESITTGVDLRGFSTDNIESIEIIRGIASVEYGDLTHGAVLVKSKAGKSPLVARFKTNPNIYQASISKGFALGGKAGDLNVSGDYAYSKAMLTAAYKNYQRANAKVLWSVFMGENTTENTSITFNYSRDAQNPNPDEAGSRTFMYANTFGLQFNTNGHSYINKGWLKSINWLLSGSYQNKTSHEEDMASNAMSLYSTAMSDGLIYTQNRGQSVYDADGNLITNVGADSDVCGRILPYSYFYAYDIYGKELNAFAKLNVQLGKSWDKVTEKILLGADFKTDGNLGEGAVYQDDAPPFRNISNESSGYRRRPYYSIPFVNQIGAYAENYFSWEFADRRQLNVTAGLRFDWVNGKTLLAPRINASVNPFPWMTVRGGFGISGKAPTSMYLNPNYAYHDAVLFNYMADKTPEAERLLLAKTSVYDVTNPDLQIAVNKKAEVGLDFHFDHYRFSLTAFREHTPNGYRFGQDASSFVWEQYAPYVKVADNPGTYPIIAKGETHNAFFETYKPLNTSDSKNYGLEYEIDLGRFKEIRTSVYINGAWMYSSGTSNAESYSNRSNGGNIERNIGIYQAGVSVGKDESVNTAIRVTHNIPSIGFVVTMTVQCEWMHKSWTEYHNDDMFVKYISHKDGKIYDFDPAKKSDPEFSYMFPPLSDSRFVAEQTQPYAFVNFNLSKEIGDWLTASFYVNNLFNTRPLYRSKVSGTLSELAIPIYFGFEFKVSIK